MLSYRLGTKLISLFFPSVGVLLVIWYVFKKDVTTAKIAGLCTFIGFFLYILLYSFTFVLYKGFILY